MPVIRYAAYLGITRSYCLLSACEELAVRLVSATPPCHPPFDNQAVGTSDRVCMRLRHQITTCVTPDFLEPYDVFQGLTAQRPSRSTFNTLDQLTIGGPVNNTIDDVALLCALTWHFVPNRSGRLPLISSGVRAFPAQCAPV
ncbi:hypothetical protein ANO14919_068900 [Xylariales sp. No.14919]|nr:hypothetical protein ANO14919_068900 [Xylariales sp. No.14919]